MFKKLIGADPELAWNLAGSRMVSKLFGDDVVAVSTLENAPCFDLGTVLVKDQQSRVAKAAHWHASFRAVGKLHDLCVSLPSCIMFGLVPQTDRYWKKPTPEKKVLAVGHEIHTKTKRIYFKVKDVEKQAIFLNMREEIRLRDDEEEFGMSKAVYIITEVFYATGLNVEVSMDGRKGTFSTDTNIPIGFRYQKFKLEEDGTIGSMLATNIKRNRAAHLLVKVAFAERINSLWKAQARGTEGDGRKPLRKNTAVVAEVLPGMIESHHSVRGSKTSSSKSADGRPLGSQAWARPVLATVHDSYDMETRKVREQKDDIEVEDVEQIPLS